MFFFFYGRDVLSSSSSSAFLSFNDLFPKLMFSLFCGRDVLSSLEVFSSSLFNLEVFCVSAPSLVLFLSCGGDVLWRFF